MKLTIKEKLLLKNLLEDKIDIFERHVRKFNKDYDHYKDRQNWIPGMKLGSDNSDYVKEIKRQIELETTKINEYKTLVEKIING